MKVTALMLCEHATVSDVGLVSMLNGGVNRIGRPLFPAALGLTLVAMFELPGDYVSGTQIQIEITITSEDETEVFGRIEGIVGSTLRPGADLRAATSPIVVDMSAIGLTKVGLYKVNMRFPGTENATGSSLFFEVDTGAAPVESS
jgi:hypothetical protein